jgi:cobalt-zinc-cadmium efflux system membrane fusion protein
MFKQRKMGIALSASLVIVAAAVLGISVLSSAKDAKESASDAPSAMMVREGELIRIPENSPLRTRLTIAAVAESNAPHVLSVPAIVEADPASISNILPPLSGRVTRLDVNVGDHVRAHQELAVLDSPDLTQAVADAVKARDAERLADEALRRAQGVNEVGANAIKDLEQAQSAQAQAKAELQRAEERLTSIMPEGSAANARQLTLRAPIAGVVTALDVGVGSLANDVTQPILTIANLDSVFVTARVPESASSAVSKGLAADIVFPSAKGEKLHGTVTSVSPVLDPDSRRLLARIRMPNRDDRLKPNMYATVELQIAVDRSISVPPSALLMNNDDTTVLVEVKPWVFARRVVQLGGEDGGSVRIISGLKAGERVVVRGGVLLND